MEMITCTRRVQFCAGHRVLRHEGKCAHPHGHNYVALFTATTDALDDVGRVIDFSVLKDKLGGWIEKNWDHGFIYFDEDEDMRNIFTEGAIDRWKAFAMPSNPTAENMAHFLLHEVAPFVLAGSGVKVIEVRLWETENCYATARLESCGLIPVE
ncbi:MAG: 6-carboxytetrahydropterin synthase [Hyphomicrobiaceae bacterium]|nr:MAG: 6-carboxytetrahydropterin synthase [Hyphomicrobiaceae bacterium]